LDESCGGDEEFRVEVIVEYLETVPGIIRGIGGCIESGDFTSVHRDAHGLKGASRTLGAGALAEVCQELEDCCKKGEQDAAHAIYGKVEREFNRLKLVLDGFVQEKA